MAIKIVIFFFVISFLSSCLPEANGRRDQDPPTIIHARFGLHDLYIPDAYLEFGHSSIGNESALLQAWYPGSAIVPGDSSIELTKQGVWWKNVRIMVSKRKSSISFDEFAHKSTPYLDATEIVGNEYGLVHYRQPDGFAQDKYDIWFEQENNKIRSYITCSEKLTENDVPKCYHDFFINNKFWIKISYDRRLLPQWKTIKQNIDDMFESFQTIESSREYVRERMAELEHARKRAE